VEIAYASRSRFLTDLETAIRNQRELVDQGEQIQVVMEDGGYPGRVTITVQTGNETTFDTDWEGTDATRFPARIKAAATALLNCGCVGRFAVGHEQGLLVIRRG
jgi:hypothetical protein